MFGSDTCDFRERTIPPAVVVFVGWAKFAGFAPITALIGKVG
jgi:hypothetical protein